LTCVLRYLHDAAMTGAPLDDSDFLGSDQSPGVRAVLAIDGVREALVLWAAGALLARHPQARLARGAKGMAAARRDLDFHLRHLHGALAAGTAPGWQAHAEWFGRVRSAGDLDAERSVLTEALQRFLPADLALVALAAWRG
jgi:hypothetical protein